MEEDKDHLIDLIQFCIVPPFITLIPFLNTVQDLEVI